MSKMCTGTNYLMMIKWCDVCLSGPQLSIISNDALFILHTMKQPNHIIVLLKVFRTQEN